MKVREDSYEKLPNNFFREYYPGCYVQVEYYTAPTITTTYVGYVISVEIDELTAILNRRPHDDEEELPRPWIWNSKANEELTKSFRRLGDKEYMMRKLQGYILPPEEVWEKG